MKFNNWNLYINFSQKFGKKWRRRINDPPFPSKNFVLNYSFGIFFFISTTNTSTTETIILRVIIVFHYSPNMYHAKGLFQKHIPVIVPVLNIYWCYVCKMINLLWFLNIDDLYVGTKKKSLFYAYPYEIKCGKTFAGDFHIHVCTRIFFFLVCWISR